MLPSYLDVLSILPNWDSNVVPHRMPKLSLNDSQSFASQVKVTKRLDAFCV